MTSSKIFVQLDVEVVRALVVAPAQAHATPPPGRVAQRLAGRSTRGPTTSTSTLTEIVNVVMRSEGLPPSLFEAANPRHAHDWPCGATPTRSPTTRCSIPGVLDSHQLHRAPRAGRPAAGHLRRDHRPRAGVPVPTAPLAPGRACGRARRRSAGPSSRATGKGAEARRPSGRAPRARAAAFPRSPPASSSSWARAAWQAAAAAAIACAAAGREVGRQLAVCPASGRHEERLEAQLALGSGGSGGRVKTAMPPSRSAPVDSGPERDRVQDAVDRVDGRQVGRRESTSAAPSPATQSSSSGRPGRSPRGRPPTASWVAKPPTPPLAPVISSLAPGGGPMSERLARGQRVERQRGARGSSRLTPCGAAPASPAATAAASA